MSYRREYHYLRFRHALQTYALPNFFVGPKALPNPDTLVIHIRSGDIMIDGPGEKIGQPPVRAVPCPTAPVSHVSVYLVAQWPPYNPTPQRANPPAARNLHDPRSRILRPTRCLYEPPRRPTGDTAP